MAVAQRKKREYTFHIDQEDLAEIEVLAPLSIYLSGS